jgi:ERF superfamily
MHEEVVTHVPAQMVAVEHSAEIGDLMTALAKAQGEMVNPENDSLNYYSKRYASMAAVRKATIPPLAAQGIATTQHPVPNYQDGTIQCITILWHGAQYLKSTMQCRVVVTRKVWKDGKSTDESTPPAELNHQQYTAVFSYLRRVALKAITGVADEEDEDGEKDTAGNQHQDGQRARQQEPIHGVTKARAWTQPPPAPHGSQGLLDEIETRCKAIISPLRNTTMHKGIYAKAFYLSSPGGITAVAPTVLDAGMPLYRHLTAQLERGAWDKEQKPLEWIEEQCKVFDAQTDAPAGVDPVTGEDLSDMPTVWLTKREQQRLAEDAEAETRERKEGV